MASAFAALADNFAMSSPRSALGRLELRDFRNYRYELIEPESGVVVLTGPNGAGKTNLLEAISLFAPGRGLRRASLADFNCDGRGPWALAVHVETPDGPLELSTGLDRSSERRFVRLFDQQMRGPSALSGLFGVSWLVPAMDRLLTDSASSRRRFLDRLALSLQPDHASRVAAYERAMRERAVLLRDGRHDVDWLKILETRMVEPAIAIAATRLDVIAALNQYLIGPAMESAACAGYQ